MYYIHKDHLGSINVITNDNAAIVEEQSFDAWGRRRNPTNWTYTSIAKPTITDRGYTGHEHLDQFNLINMNGRVYDPLIGRMLSPDITVQAPGNSQSFNRYSYCLNNPLKYTDPSGWFTNNTTNTLGEKIGDNPGFTPAVWEIIQAVYHNTPEGTKMTYSGEGAQMMAVIWTDLGNPQGVYFANGGQYGFLLPVATVTAKAHYKTTLAYKIFGELASGKNTSNANPYMPPTKIPFPDINVSLDPTIKYKQITGRWISGSMELQSYTKTTTHKGNPYISNTFHSQSLDRLATDISSPIAKISVGANGDFKAGNNWLTIGTNNDGRLIVDMSLPAGNGSTVGTQIAWDPQNTINAGTYLLDAINSGMNNLFIWGPIPLLPAYSF
jgi:RHS repeat-associated protein